jgi:PTH1 family peptidyl-tRNA hydrolase
MSAAEHRIQLVVGLGNPGREYEKTRHNAGFEAIDALLKMLPGSYDKKEGFSGIYWEGRFKGQNLTLLKPMTFMNLSGKSVAGLVMRKELQPEEIMLVYDDVDLPLGKIRLRKDGSSAGHNGVESVINSLESQKFARLRIGIGGASRGQQIDHVLSKFPASEQPVFDKVIKAAADAVIMAVSRGIAAAMNSFNGMEIGVEENKENPGVAGEKTKTMEE